MPCTYKCCSLCTIQLHKLQTAQGDMRNPFKMMIGQSCNKVVAETRCKTKPRVGLFWNSWRVAVETRKGHNPPSAYMD